MLVKIWGTRGSLPCPGPETVGYGGNTSCVEVRGNDGTLIILDAGTGIRRLGTTISQFSQPIHLLLTHLHMDHILGLGFFGHLYNPSAEVHIWGPPSTTMGLWERLSRYMSPPLFPVRLRDVASSLHLHELTAGEIQIGEFIVSSALVCHPGPTVGYRINASQGSIAYLPDHEPALGVGEFPLAGDWTSGHQLAAEVDLLIHDCQYSEEEYGAHIGWGHSSLEQTLQFATQAGVKQLVPFHYDPSHDDKRLDRLIGEAVEAVDPPFAVTPGIEGAEFEVP